MEETVEGRVGLFWFAPEVDGEVVLMAHRCWAPEEYGEALTCRHAHYDVWEGWRERYGWRASHPWKRALIQEYEDWPRGRVIYARADRRFLLYADAQIFRYGLDARVIEHFALPVGAVAKRRDEHYVSSLKLGSASGG